METMTARVAVLRNRQSQALRIPQEMSFPDDVTELEMTRVGDVITLRSPRKSWEAFEQMAAELAIPDDDPFFAYLEGPSGV